MARETAQCSFFHSGHLPRTSRWKEPSALRPRYWRFCNGCTRGITSRSFPRQLSLHFEDCTLSWRGSSRTSDPEDDYGNRPNGPVHCAVSLAWFLQAQYPLAAPRLDFELWHPMGIYEVELCLSVFCLLFASIKNTSFSEIIKLNLQIIFIFSRRIEITLFQKIPSTQNGIITDIFCFYSYPCKRLLHIT